MSSYWLLKEEYGRVSGPREDLILSLMEEVASSREEKDDFSLVKSWRAKTR